jgi:hypothetical protein
MSCRSLHVAVTPQNELFTIHPKWGWSRRSKTDRGRVVSDKGRKWGFEKVCLRLQADSVIDSASKPLLASQVSLL